MSEWISVKDRLPKREQLCVIFGYDLQSCVVDDCGYMIGYRGITMGAKEEVWFASVDLGVFRAFDSDSLNVTHWMPLPDPPEVTGDV